jgi:hypothetical protein
MKYYKHVEAGEFEKYSIDFLRYYKLNKNSKFQWVNHFWNPLDASYNDDFLEQNPLFREGISKFGEINEITLLILNGDTSTLHIDHESRLNKGMKARLNIPVANCKGSYTAFFKFTPEEEAKKDLYPGEVWTWPREVRDTVKPILEFQLLQPTIIRTSEPHTVFCRECKFPRISLTISFKEDVVKYLDEE